MKMIGLWTAGSGLILVLATAWWIASDAPPELAATDPSNAVLVDRGATVYADNCAACHGKNLEGETPKWRTRRADGKFPAPPHDRSGHTWHHGDDILFEITKHGRLKSSAGSSSSSMPGFAAKLSDRDIWAVLSFIKSRWPASIRRRHDRINRQAKLTR